MPVRVKDVESAEGCARVEPTRPTDGGLLALCAIARFHQVAADPAALAHQLGLAASKPATVADLLAAAHSLGLKAKHTTTTSDRLSLTPLPAMAVLGAAAAGSRIVILAQCDGQRVLVQDPSVGGPPAIQPLDAFAAQWTGELVLIASRASLAGQLARFDFSWFIPSLVKYRKLFGEVLLISLFLQLFALVSPLFFQVVMDKVLVHRGMTTLDVLVIGLVVVVVFESLLSGLRSYVFSHTTSRIDVELGARLFRHLVNLPLAYFQARRVGDSVARVRELENIRSFLTGNTLTVLLDVVFSVIFIAVMLFYSVPLTLIVLVSLPLYFGLSLMVVPILRGRLNEKFARGAENQAMLVETVTAIQTVKAGALEPSFGRRWDNQLAGYVVDNKKDVVIENANQGYDRIESQVTYTLPDNVESILLKGTRNIAATGNALANELIGNSGNNRLDGGAGNDKMSGGAGNDVYVIDSTGDQVIELASEGTDTVIASVSYTLPENVERLTLTGAGLTGIGNDLANLMIASDAGSTLEGLAGNDTLRGGAGSDTLLGGDGNDRLEGGAGADRMEGGAGNDVYLVDDATDVVIELAGGGTDTVRASVSLTLAPNVENLTLTGSADIGGTGNDLDNTIVGNAGRNILSGLGGNDRLRGGAGDDQLLGGEGNDRLDGGAGADQLAGGAGNDTYIVDDAGDRVDELVNEGTDTVQASVSYVLGANVENLTLTGTGLLSGSGNELNNVLVANGAGSILNGLAGNDTLKGGAGHDVLVGGEGNDRLDGGGSADKLVGGTGNDLYVVDDPSDEVIELADEGTDTVQSSISYALVANVENLTLTGSASLNATGNELGNVIIGNAAANRLAGLAGNDTLKGGAAGDLLIGGTGNDRLEGGLGSDTYDFGRGDGQDTIVENDPAADAVDTLHFEAGIAASQLWWRKTGNNLEVSVIGSSDKVTLSNWYLGAERHVEVFELADGHRLLDTQVQTLVQAMASFSPPAAGQTSLPPNYQSSLNGVLAASWH